MDWARAPFEPDRLDELLSAELDGELDAAAHDLGLTLAEVSARVRATPGAGARRTALAAARELLGRPDEIDELTASRLRAAAVSGAASGTPTATTDPTRHRKVLVGLGVAAASVAALGALAVLASGLGDTSTAKSSSAGRPVEGAAGTGGTVEKRPTTVPTAALGEFTDQGALARAAVAHDATKRSGSGAATSSGQSSQQGFAPAAADVPTATPAPLKQTEKSAADTLHPPETPVATNGSDSTRAAPCSTPPGIPAGAAEVLRATATLSGNPVIVLVFAGRDEHVVVTEDVHCVVKNLQMLR
jgi:hypothetical protein